MGEFLGAIAGLMMITLILVLLFKFLTEVGLKVSENIIYCAKKYTLWGFVFLMAMLVAAGIPYMFYNGADSIMDFDTLWTFATYIEYKGTPSLYNLILKGFSAILFEQTSQCAMYISFLSAAVTCTAVAVTLKKISGGDEADRCFIILMCSPAAYLIFMPAPYAMFLATFAVFVALIAYDRKKIAVLPVIIGLATHVNGVLLLILWALFMWIFTSQKYTYEVLVAVTFIVQISLIIFSIIKGWNTVEQNVFTLAIPLILWLSNKKLIMNDNIFKPAFVVYMLCSGFVMYSHFFEI